MNTKIYEVSGYSDHVKEARAGWLAVVGRIMAGPWPEGPSEKPFKPKHDLPKLGNYKREATREFWGRFPRKEVAPARALVSKQALERAVEVWGCEDKERFRTVYRDLEGGADIGCRGPFRGGFGVQECGKQLLFWRQGD